MDFEKFLSFSRLLNTFAGVERVINMPGTGRKENDVEHSYHLALMAWYIVETQKLDLDIGKILKYALVHDMVEIHAGDTWVWDKERLEGKQEREAAAAVELKKSFSEFPGMHDAIEQYERREDKESRFVYALDKIVPCILIREEEGKLWQECDVTFDMLQSKKAPQVALSPEIEPYFNKLMELIQEEGITAKP